MEFQEFSVKAIYTNMAFLESEEDVIVTYTGGYFKKINYRTGEVICHIKSTNTNWSSIYIDQYERVWLQKENEKSESKKHEIVSFWDKNLANKIGEIKVK